MNLMDNSIKYIKEFGKERLVSLIHKFNRSEIKSIFIWTMMEYQQTASIYSIRKDNCANGIDAFVSLWLASKIDYENWWSFNNCISESEAEVLYEHQLKKYIDCIEISFKEPKFFSQYSKSKIDEKIRCVKNLWNRYPVNSDNFDVAEYVDNGIYLDYKFINEDKFNFEEVNVVSGYQLYYDPSYAGYRDLFFESEDEYFYFRE